jgi:uncharacterized protein
MNRHRWLAICLLLFPTGIGSAQDVGTVETKVKTVMLDPTTRSPVVVLEAVADKRLLPIWIDIAEARAIALELEKVKPPRPLTHDLMRNILKDFGATLERAVITELRNTTYHALLYLKLKGQDWQIDARPSDAMALALKMDAPIFVSSQVFAQSKAVPAPRRMEETQLKLGVQAQDLTPELAALFDVGIASGIVVAVVEAGSPAALAGIQRGDIITKANDSVIKSTGDLEDLIQTIKAPAKIKLEIMKKGKPTTVQIDLR